MTMKKAILYGLVSSGVLLLAGCNESWNAGSSGEGSIIPIVSLDTNTLSSRSEKHDSRGAADEITVDDLRLTLTSTATGATRQWASVSDFKVDEKFNVGTYTFEAVYGDKSSEGFNSPYYYGVTSVAVRENETARVALTASLANAMLSLKYTDAFTGYFNNYSVDIKTTTGNTIAYSRNENRPAYVAAGTVQLLVNVDKPNGTSATYQALSFNAVAKHHYNITLNVNEGNVGNAELVISFDDSMTAEDVVIDLSEDLENVPAPTVTADGFTSGEAIDVVAGSDAANQLLFSVMARGGIASAVLATQSTSLVEQGWPATVDLVAASAATQTTMSSLGFSEIGLWQNPDKMAVVDLTKVIPFMRYIEGASNESTFTLTVTDRITRQSQPVTLTVNLEKLTVEIVEAETLMYYDDTVVFDFDYNGIDVENRVVAQYKTVYGTWNDLKIEKIAAKSRAMTTYAVTASGVPADANQGEKDVVLRLVVKNALGEQIQLSNEFTIARARVPYTLAVADNDVFALRAAAVMTHESESIADFASRAKIELSTDGGVNYSEYNYTFDGSYVRLDGLKPSTTYTARIKADGMTCRPVTFTTEADLDIPNAGMEEWYSENGKSSNQKWYYPWSQGATNMDWNTYNPVTMSQGGSGAGGYAYKATSGTVFTADANSGSSAAQIRTVGWGSGNTASGNAFAGRWGFGTCKHVSAGQLFLGNWDGIDAVQDATPNYGIAFASRPSSMTFMYKYAMMNRNGNDNGQKGVAIIRVLDANGNIVAETTQELDANATYSNISADTDCSVGGSYAEKTLSLNYPAGSAKAAKLVVIFKSSQLSNSDLESRTNQDNIRPPKPLNLSTHEYVGSSLLIDDITLNY